MNYKCTIMFFIMYYTSILQGQDGPWNCHVLFSLKKPTKKIIEIKSNNEKIHNATYEIKQVCKKKYKHSIESNPYYPQRRDSVFFIHCDHDTNSWTLYKPSFIPYNQFIKIAKKIYNQHGLQVICSRDQLVTTLKNNNLENSYMTLDELEECKKKSDKDLQVKIQKLENNDDHIQEFKRLENLRNIKKYLFWHLQVPTTGLLPAEKYDIDDQYKPLAWHFLLWDLAPKKGKGARVAMIDTGVSAFNIADKEFSSMYKKNINITVDDDLLDYGYNLMSKDGLDPIRQLAINFGHYCDHEKFEIEQVMTNLPEWIIGMIKNKNSFLIEQYFLKNAKKEYLNQSNNTLNEKGKDALKDLLYGKYGIMPFEKNSFFHIVQLKEPYNQEVLLETLPAPKIIGNDDPFAAGHGTFTQGIVNGHLYNNLGIFGLAPDAHVTMIKAFNDKGTTNKTTLNAALQRAKLLKTPIVSMSLKITDDINTTTDAPLKDLVDSIDYVVAACGNDGKNQKLKNKEAYPAKFDSVAFDIGAFAYNDGKYPICPFTQKELNIGPKFVAPGFNLISAGLTPDQTVDSMYVFMSGTSIAVPVITGFLALVLAEFQEIFSREQILKVIYKFSMKLNHDEIWGKYIKIGTPDMRSCLLCLHALEFLKKNLEQNLKTPYPFEKNFDNLIQALYIINYYVPSSYEKEVGCSFTQDFSNYNSATKSPDSYQKSIEFFIPQHDSLKECVHFIKNLITTSLGEQETYAKKYPKLIEKLTTTLNDTKINLFENYSSSSKTRIKKALTPRKTITDSLT